MTEKLADTRSGFPTAYCGTKPIHSVYDPKKEAERYTASLSVKDGTRYFILLEPGLGYCIEYLRYQFPGVRILAVHCSSFFAGTGSPDAEWEPEEPVSLQKWLEREIPDSEAVRVQIIEWKPSAAAYGTVYRDVLAETAEFLRRAAANSRTAEYFGPRWLRNVDKNFRGITRFLRINPGTAPIIITGAGPGLEDSLDLIKRASDNRNAFILAAASSVPALLGRDITPDLIISTDGGNWAHAHLFETIRYTCRSKRQIPLAAPLSAALPSQYMATPILVLGDGTAWQNSILDLSGIPRLSLPQRGTVTASALDLALFLTSGTLYAAGMDLESRDLRSHARPYSLDSIVTSGVNRLDPAYSRFFDRSVREKAGNSFGIYAAWFKEYLRSFPRKIYSLGTIHRDLRGNVPGASAVNGKGAFPQFIPAETAQDGREGLPKLLEGLYSRNRLQDAAIRELGEFAGIPGEPGTIDSILRRIREILS
ncbi:6-hydroxymethylpterin diphosphokinase MptE-like protein [Breznakiella homolactica]|uniref:DUF115 domain-containing protein n=1 Tax=Breznakiella homolactica TaxID=2798577 RepID=A0A7T8BA85_9SPIR|nr:6-hydroxymethylpterin diphosphokinase MptE-like protein [Breznakiella homolactica]QQO07968.1 DUF115 domain-containing protein [Breznakiella homolactica]